MNVACSVPGVSCCRSGIRREGAAPSPGNAVVMPMSSCMLREQFGASTSISLD